MSAESAVIGRLLESDCTGMTFACLEGLFHAPALGALIRMAGGSGRQVFGLVTGVAYPEDLLALPYVRPDLEQGVIDEVVVRGGGPRITARYVGYSRGQQFIQGLPPHPPVALSEIHLCSHNELAAFTASGPGYLRLLIEPGGGSGPVDALAIHISRSYYAQHPDASAEGWLQETVCEMVRLLREDLPVLRRFVYALDDLLG